MGAAHESRSVARIAQTVIGGMSSGHDGLTERVGYFRLSKASFR
jgi:hypothetical protein